jgi:hypothetical protein
MQYHAEPNRSDPNDEHGDGFRVMLDRRIWARRPNLGAARAFARRLAANCPNRKVAVVDLNGTRYPLA